MSHTYQCDATLVIVIPQGVPIVTSTLDLGHGTGFGRFQIEPYTLYPGPQKTHWHRFGRHFPSRVVLQAGEHCNQPGLHAGAVKKRP